MAIIGQFWKSHSRVLWWLMLGLMGDKIVRILGFKAFPAMLSFLLWNKKESDISGINLFCTVKSSHHTTEHWDVEQSKIYWGCNCFSFMQPMPLNCSLWQTWGGTLSGETPASSDRGRGRRTTAASETWHKTHARSQLHNTTSQTFLCHALVKSFPL